MLELLLVIAILGMLMMLVLPVMHKANVRAKRTACMSQLHQVGIAAHDFAHDHNDQFPHQVSTNTGGTREFAHAGFSMSGEFFFAYRHFQALSNSLETPKILRCPADHGRERAGLFAELRNQNVSYFAGLSAEYTQPFTWLAGDAGIEAEALAGGAILRLSTNVPPAWGANCHEERGNILFSDSHVESANNARLLGAAEATGQRVVYLLPPFLPAANPPEGSDVTPGIALAQYFAIQSGNSGSAGAPPAGGPYASVPATDATPAAGGMRDPQSKPASPVAATRPVTNGLGASNAALASGSPSPNLRSSAAPTMAARRTPPADSNSAEEVLMFIARPERNFGWWLLLLVVVAAVSFALGWRVHKERVRRRASMLPRPLSPA